MTEKEQVTVGFFTTGLAAYWPQMPGILEEILGYAGTIVARLSSYGTVVNAGMVDTTDKARAAQQRFLTEDVDIVVVHAGTYGLSRNVLHALRRCRVPVLTLHLQPDITFDRNAATVYTMPKNPFSIGGEIAAVFRRTGVAFDVVAGRLSGDERPWKEIGEWIDAVRIVKRLRGTTIGLLGHVFGGMYDLYVDYLKLIEVFGIDVDMVEMGHLRRDVESVTPAEIERVHATTERLFEIDPATNREGLTWCEKVAAGMEKTAASRNLQGFSFQFEGYPDSVEEKIGYSLTLGGCLLNAAGIPCTAEGDLCVTLAMNILAAAGIGSTQAELNIVDFDDDVNYVNHSGPGNVALAGALPALRWLSFFHGKRGSGVSSEFSVRPGPVTLLALTPGSEGRLRLTAAEGEAVEGFRLPNGNMNTRVRFASGAAGFFEKWTATGPTHHAAMGTGHHLGLIRKFARTRGLELVIVE